jgi:hypothetical protein
MPFMSMFFMFSGCAKARVEADRAIIRDEALASFMVFSFFD